MVQVDNREQKDLLKNKVYPLLFPVDSGFERKVVSNIMKGSDSLVRYSLQLLAPTTGGSRNS